MLYIKIYNIIYIIKHKIYYKQIKKKKIKTEKKIVFCFFLYQNGHHPT